MKKTDVYVVVDTPKKAKKLKRVLDMFGEGVYENRVWNNDGYTYYSFDYYIEYWVGDSLRDSEDMKKKTEVSIKDLRNILAREHLKPGDTVILKDQDNYSVCEFEGIAGNSFGGQFMSRKYCRLDGVEISFSGGVHENFIRYATEEEKGLFNHNIVDEDVAIIERLHDTLLENHGYSLDSELLTNARKLALKLRNK